MQIMMQNSFFFFAQIPQGTAGFTGPGPLFGIRQIANEYNYSQHTQVDVNIVVNTE